MAEFSFLRRQEKISWKSATILHSSFGISPPPKGCWCVFEKRLWLSDSFRKAAHPWISLASALYIAIWFVEIT